MIEWTQDRVDTLKTLWASGISTREIAVTMMGDSSAKNVIIGKVHRLGLEKRREFKAPAIHRTRGDNNPLGPKRIERISAAPQFEPDDTLQRIETAPPPAQFLGIPFRKLKDEHCRYPRGGDGSPTLFCGQPKKPGSSYCPDCHARCCPRKMKLSPEEIERRKAQGRKNFESRAFP